MTCFDFQDPMKVHAVKTFLNSSFFTTTFFVPSFIECQHGFHRVDRLYKYIGMARTLHRRVCDDTYYSSEFFLARPSLLLPSILCNCFLYLSPLISSEIYTCIS